MSNSLTLIDTTKQRVSTKFAQLNTNPQDKLSSGISGGYGVLHIKGGKFSVQIGGGKHFFTRPDDGTLQTWVDLVILRQSPGKTRSYYPKWDDEGSEGKRPVCSSLNGTTPDPDVEQKQAEVCALCPRNERKLNPETNTRTTECRENKRLAVTLLPAQTAKMPGGPYTDALLLRVPAASLSNLKAMGDEMDRQGAHYSSYITRITMDQTKSYPRLVFTAFQFLKDHEADHILVAREEPLPLQITGEDDLARALPAPRGTQQIIPPEPKQATAPPPAPAAVIVQSAPLPAGPLDVDTGFGAAVAVGPDVTAFASPASLTLAPAPTPAPIPAPQAAQTVVDTGPATAATAELDAQILALFPDKKVA